MNKLIWKGLLMTVIVFIATAIETSGVPKGALEWQVLGITMFGTVVGYIGQSVIFPSTSILGDINLRDLMKGGLLALSNMLSGYAASAITNTAISWGDLLATSAMVLVGYFVKQFATPPTGTPPAK